MVYLTDFLDGTQQDVDCADTVYDITICVSDLLNSQDDNYGKFCYRLSRQIKAERINSSVAEYRADFTGFLKDNLDAFKQLAFKYWKTSAYNENFFIFELLGWIMEMYNGTLSESTYGSLIKDFEDLKVFKR